MKKRFVLAIEGLNADEQKQVTELISDGYSWWHWIDGFWLVVDNTGELTPTKLREMTKGVNENSTRLVIEISDSQNWSGYGPNSENRNMFDWLHGTWDSK